MLFQDSEEPETIKPLYDAVVAAAPDYDIDRIMTEIMNNESKKKSYYNTEVDF